MFISNNLLKPPHAARNYRRSLIHSVLVKIGVILIAKVSWAEWSFGLFYLQISTIQINMKHSTFQYIIKQQVLRVKRNWSCFETKWNLCC